jgi:hypothetical protein
MGIKPTKKKVSIFDLYRNEIIEYLRIGLNTAAIVKLINVKLPNSVTSAGLRRYIKREGLDKKAADNCGIQKNRSYKC